MSAIAGPAATGAAPAVSRETLARLQALAERVGRWNRAINLVAPSTLEEIWERHILDSLQLLRLAPAEIRHWADLGSGGGFPGLVAAADLAARAPAARVTLVESDRRKAAFLRSTAAALGLEVAVAEARIEALAPLGADVVSARALAPLPRLIPLVRRHLAPGGIALLPKGERAAAEIAATALPRELEITRHPSDTAPGATILKLSERRDA
jgi:16S rRNA (guanine527-N7)-methyltransferase